MSIDNNQKIIEAQDVLKQLGFPKKQQNIRSALTLLALLKLKPSDPWSNATAPLCGITPMMEFFSTQYGKKYAPNTRETVRRNTVHQFVQAKLVLVNPDDPNRPTNSDKTVYQIANDALVTLRMYENKNWNEKLAQYLLL